MSSPRFSRRSIPSGALIRIVAVNEFLIDTNIYSHAMRADPAVVSLLRRASRIVLSSISIGELLSGFKGGTQEQQKPRGTGRVPRYTARVDMRRQRGYSRVLCRDPRRLEEIWNPDPDERHLDCGAGHGARFATGLDGSPLRIRGGIAAALTRGVRAARGERRIGRTNGKLIYSRNKSGRKRRYAKANYVPTVRPHHAQIR